LCGVKITVYIKLHEGDDLHLRENWENKGDIMAE
jgi:hypothetical protein